MSQPRWHELLKEAEHRPWPLPSKPWVMTMSWLDLLFAHWSVDADALQAKLPQGLELETYDDRAWIGVVPFRMESVGPRGLGWWPASWPGPRAFPELNVRTYVRAGGYSGVFFFSLDATSRLAVEGARRFFHLPYAKAEITCRNENGWTQFSCRRRDPRMGPGSFQGRYRPISKVLAPSEVTPFEHWLTERYCLYSADPKGRLWRSQVHHLPWPLQRAEAEIEHNSITVAHGLELTDRPATADRPATTDRPAEPVLHSARQIDVVAWGLEAV